MTESKIPFKTRKKGYLSLYSSIKYMTAHPQIRWQDVWWPDYGNSEKVKGRQRRNDGDDRTASPKNTKTTWTSELGTEILTAKGWSIHQRDIWQVTVSHDLVEDSHLPLPHGVKFQYNH